MYSQPFRKLIGIVSNEDMFTAIEIQIKTPLRIDWHAINSLSIMKWIFFLVQCSGVALTIDTPINDAAILTLPAE